MRKEMNGLKGNKLKMKNWQRRRDDHKLLKSDKIVR